MLLRRYSITNECYFSSQCVFYVSDEQAHWRATATAGFGEKCLPYPTTDAVFFLSFFIIFEIDHFILRYMMASLITPAGHCAATRGVPARGCRHSHTAGIARRPGAPPVLRKRLSGWRAADPVEMAHCIHQAWTDHLLVCTFCPTACMHACRPEKDAMLFHTKGFDELHPMVILLL